MSLRDATPAETPDRAGIADATQHVTPPSFESERLEQGARRLREYAARAERERAVAVGLGSAQGVSATPRLSPRTEEIDRMCAAYAVPLTATEPSAQKLREVNASLRELRDSLVANPLWVSATLQEVAPPPAPGEHLRHALRRMEPELAMARDEVARCAGKVLDAEEVLRAWESRPAWVRAAQDWLLQTGQHARDDLSAAKGEVAIAQASLDEKHARAEAQAVEAKAAEEHADRERRERASFDREILETPLREALLERAMLDEALRGRHVQPLSEAPAEERLTMVGLRREPGFTVAVLTSKTTEYVADCTALDEADKATLTRAIGGDVLRYERREDGARALEIVELAPLTPEHGTLEGLVGATHYRNNEILEFQLIDASGTARWVKPSVGDDLLHELRGDVATALISGTRIRIQNREVHILGRARTQSFER